MFKYLAIAGGALALSACAAMSPPPEPIPVVDTQHADFGPYPKDPDALIKAWATAHLKDPESAHFASVSKPRKEYMIADSKPFFGFSVCVGINAKNSYGGYTGSQLYWFLIRDDKIARAQNTQMPIMSLIPGTTISREHFVNCADGDERGN